MLFSIRVIRMSQTEGGQIRAPEPNTDLGILVGLLLTDGCVRYSCRTWKIIFSGKSKELAKIFKQKIRKIFGVKKFTSWVDKNGVESIQISSKKIAAHLLKFTPSFRTKPFKDGSFDLTKIPDFFWDLPTESLAEILRVMFSADGSIILGAKWNKTKKMWTFTRRVQLTSVNPNIKQQIARLLKEKFNLKPTIWKNDAVMEKKDDIKKFQKIIGFVEGVKISGKSKNWKGLEKNQILELAIKSMELKKRDLEKFKTKEEVINFLKSFLTAPTPNAERV